MNELFARISSYNIFNYLVPGALFCIALGAIGGPAPAPDDIATALLTYYVVGMVLSRIGSLAIGRGTRRWRARPRTDYATFVRALAADDRIPVLQETANTYRTVAAAFAVLVLAKAAQMLGLPRLVDPHWATLLGLALLAALFTGAYVKQVGYVDRRVRIGGKAEDDDG